MIRVSISSIKPMMRTCLRVSTTAAVVCREVQNEQSYMLRTWQTDDLIESLYKYFSLKLEHFVLISDDISYKNFRFSKTS
jgi:hypothetical protein